MSRYLLPTLIVFLVGCHPKTMTSQPPAESKKVANAPQLVFITLKITNGIDGKKVELIGSTKVEGSVPEPLYPAEGNYVVLSLLDDTKKILGFARHQHPLLTDVEFIAEGQQIERKKVELKEAVFFVRMPFQAATRYIRLEEMVDGKLTELAALKY